MKDSSVPAAEIDGAAAYDEPGVRFAMAPRARPVLASIGTLQMFTFPAKLEKNMRFEAPFRCSIAEACKSSEVVNVRRAAGPVTLPAFDTGTSQRLVVSPCVAENRIRFGSGSQAIGVIQSCPCGGIRFCERNGAKADALTAGPPLRGTTHQSTPTLEPCFASGLPTSRRCLEAGAQTGQQVATRLDCTGLAGPPIEGFT